MANTSSHRHAPSTTTRLATLPPTRQCLSNKTLIPSRSFATTPTLLKKGGKAAREEKQAAAQKDPSGGSASEDPSDFTALENEISQALERLKEDLSKLRAGGRFNPEVLEALRVQPDKASNTKVKLGDLAQVVPKGRTVQVIVGEKDVSYDFREG